MSRAQWEADWATRHDPADAMVLPVSSGGEEMVQRRLLCQVRLMAASPVACELSLHFDPKAHLWAAITEADGLRYIGDGDTLLEALQNLEST